MARCKPSHAHPGRNERVAHLFHHAFCSASIRGRAVVGFDASCSPLETHERGDRRTQVRRCSAAPLGASRSIWHRAAGEEYEWAGKASREVLLNGPYLCRTFELYFQYQTKDGAHPPFHGRSVLTRENREICCCWCWCQMWIRILCPVSRSALITVLWRLLHQGRPLWTCLTQQPSSFYVISVQIILNLEQTDEFFSEADIPDWVTSSLCRSGQVQSLLESSLLWGVLVSFCFLFYSLKTGSENNF